MKHLQDIFHNLELTISKGLYLLDSSEAWRSECGFSDRINNLLSTKIQPDAFFCFDHKPLILFFDNPTNKKTIFKAIWNFNESAIVFIIENGNINIYNGFSYLRNKESLKLIGNENKLTDFKYFKLVTGKSWEKYESDLKQKNRVDYLLLDNIKATRIAIVKKVFPKWSPKQKVNSNEEQKIIQLANNLIGKVIFVSYLIDRNVEISFEGIKKKWKRRDFCHLLENIERTKAFFSFLKQDDQFNGDDLFPISDIEFNTINDYGIIQVIIDLLNGVEVSSGQQSLFDIYDFSVIPVEFISNVYESFIGEAGQAKEGAYYTPLFLVEYITSQTIDKYFEKNITKYECKVLDPACGSGIFLVESLRKMISRYMALHNDWKTDISKFQTEIKQIASDNIFGVDKDSNAINVAVFSIYLTLLDYQSPKDIDSFQFPNIKETNFVNRDFFADTDDLNALKRVEFDFILGNPPWNGHSIGTLGKLYLKQRIVKEKPLQNKYHAAVNNGEIAEGFVLRVSDFCKVQTQIALIVRSSILYNLGYKEYSEFRQYWLQEFRINQIFELAPVRKEVFNNSNVPAIAPAAILFYKYAFGENTDQAIIKHISLKPSRFFSIFKTFALNRTDFKEVQQRKLKQFDWLWKTLVYGSYLDFNFIQNLKSNYPSIKTIISNESKFVVGTGIHYRSFELEQPKDISEVKKLSLISTDAVDVMFINYNKKNILKEKQIDVLKDTRLYYSPMLLVRKGLDTKMLKAKSAISQKNLLFKDSLTAIKLIEKQNISILQKIEGLLFSELYSYMAINTFASIGIEREQTQNYNKFSIPFIDYKIDELIIRIESLKKEIFIEKKKITEESIVISELEIEVNNRLIEMDKRIFDSLKVSDQEKATIDFALNINRPIISKDKNALQTLFNSIPYQDSLILDYAKLFINRFKTNLEDKNDKFVVEIWHSNHIIGMFFKMIPSSEYKNKIIWKEKSSDIIMSRIANLSSEKITERLFVQKDIRGFEKDSFYIFKPNEKRLWHKAIAYLDIDEFMDAMLLAAKGDKHE